MSYSYGNNAMQSTNVPNSKYKTMLCRHYQATKQCAIGAKCQFAHGPNELRSINDPLPAQALSALTSGGIVDNKPEQAQPRFKIPCKYHQMNYCKNGPSCQYMHDPEPQQQPQQQTYNNPYMNAYQQNIQIQQQPIYQEQQQRDDGLNMVLLMILHNLEQIFQNREDIIQQLKVAQDQVKCGNLQYGSDMIRTITHSPERTPEEMQAYKTIYENSVLYFQQYQAQQQPQQY